MSDRDDLARALDPEAFEDHPIEQRSHVAAVQWAARRKLATDAAERAYASGYRKVPTPTAPEWVREVFVRGREKTPQFRGINLARDEFDRWLAAHDAEVERATAAKAVQMIEERAARYSGIGGVLVAPEMRFLAAHVQSEFGLAPFGLAPEFGLAPDEKGGE